jgi:opacity protein-like surface antigen
MANLFYAPLEARGSNSRFQPFVVGGIGMSRNTVESWTRFNLDAGTPPGSGPATRVFGENSENPFAWSVGLGASWQLTESGERPILLDVGWRYYDFGTAEGGSTADVGAGIPRQPLNFDLTSQVFSIGIRIPLQRY